MNYAGARPRRRPHIHSRSSRGLTRCRDCSATWAGIRTRGDRPKGELEAEGTGAGPITQAYNLEVIKGPFCLESRGQLSVCLPISALSPTGGDDGLIQPTPHRQEDRDGNPARTESLNLQRASAEKMITSRSPPPLNSGEREVG